MAYRIFNMPKIEMSGRWIKNICTILDKYLLEEEKD